MYSEFVERSRAFFDHMYDDYEKWLAIPVIMLLLAIGMLGFTKVTTGEFVSKGIEFTGGTEIQVAVPSDVTEAQVQQAFGSVEGTTAVRTLSTQGDTKRLLVEAQVSLQQERIETLLTDAGITYQGEISVYSIGSVVSQSFLLEAQIATLIAFAIMSTVIFIAFRSFVPSMAVILAAFTDIVVAVAGMSLLGIDLTLGSLAALLMLIGYSVDTDIVLSTRVLKQRKRDLQDRVWDSITTGTTMTLGAITAFTVLFLVSTSPTLDQIASVILLGLMADIPITWLGNAVILKMHAEGRI